MTPHKYAVVIDDKAVIVEATSPKEAYNNAFATFQFDYSQINSGAEVFELGLVLKIASENR